ncbi:MAG TPA: hypothetical protein PLB76_01005, partial [Anaerohalosphaeraceae bacterium]|nr:hypothetical protein [Anaerohalosphaeraceae bacterium]
TPIIGRNTLVYLTFQRSILFQISSILSSIERQRKAHCRTKPKRGTPAKRCLKKPKADTKAGCPEENKGTLKTRPTHTIYIWKLDRRNLLCLRGAGIRRCIPPKARRKQSEERLTEKRQDIFSAKSQNLSGRTAGPSSESKAELEN